MKTTYKNRFHNPKGADGLGRHYTFGPEFYETDATPVEHAGHLIFQREDFGYTVFDVVKDGVCLTQRAGLNGAKRAAEEL